MTVLCSDQEARSCLYSRYLNSGDVPVESKPLSS